MRVKGFPDAVDATYQHSGRLHEIENPGSRYRVFDSGNVAGLSLDELKSEIEDIICSGNAAVSNEFEGELARFQSHEVFLDKIIEERRSAHGVSFGRFVLRQGVFRPRERRNKLSVAMKPFASTDHAARECAGYVTLATKGIETFSPVGVFSSLDSDNFVVVTEKRNDFVSLDRDEWLEGMQVTSENDVESLERNTRTVTEIAQLLAYMNVLGIFHPDGQIKNWAVDQSGTIGVIDTENLMQLELHDPNTAEMAASGIDKLLKSLVNNQRENKIFGVGLFHGISGSNLHEIVMRTVIIPYTDVLMEMSIDGQVDDKQAEILIDGVLRHADQEGDAWPGCLSVDAH